LNIIEQHFIKHEEGDPVHCSQQGSKSLNKEGMPVYQLYREQKLPAGMEAVWDFISDPRNLKTITPDYMGFDILSEKLPERIYPGMIITYTVRPVFRVKMNWVTEITHLAEGEYFVDEQRVGPYRMWHHHHRIQPDKEGVLMTDLVTYRPPLGFLGSLANRLIISKRLEEIFRYRQRKLIQIFGDTDR
jgi:ligand-binding SRPBCC domain-containing protein